MAGSIDKYYDSHQKLPFIGINGQHQFAQSKVLVIGAGGLGCPCLQYLAGCGIGIIGIADFDLVSVSNLHRQFLYNTNDIGKSKVKAAVEKLSIYNPLVHFNIHNVMVDENIVLPLIKDYDVIVDCTDNFLVRYLINDACVYLDKPLVYGAIHQTEGHVTVFNFHQSPTLRCLFPEAEINESIQSCAAIGAYNIITGIIGLFMANEVIKIILNHSDVLTGTLNCFDALNGKSTQVKYNDLIESRQKSVERFEKLDDKIEISPERLLSKMNSQENILLIDVRKADERKVFNIGGEHIPEEEFFKSSFKEIPDEEVIIIYCEKGIRSLGAAKYLRNTGFKNTYSLQGGMYWWQQYFKKIENVP